MNIDVKNIVKTISRKQRGLQDPQLIYPDRDWVVGMVGTLFILCLAVVFCVIQYKSYTNPLLDEEAVSALVPYKTAIVEQALVKYKEQAELHTQIVASSTVELSDEVDTDTAPNMDNPETSSNEAEPNPETKNIHPNLAN